VPRGWLQTEDRTWIVKFDRTWIVKFTEILQNLFGDADLLHSAIVNLPLGFRQQETPYALREVARRCLRLAPLGGGRPVRTKGGAEGVASSCIVPWVEDVTRRPLVPKN